MPALSPAAHPGAVSLRAERARWGRAVRQELGRLPTLQQTALALIYFEHLTQAETATRLGLSLTEVKALVAAALRRISPGCLAG